MNGHILANFWTILSSQIISSKTINLNPLGNQIRWPFGGPLFSLLNHNPVIVKDRERFRFFDLACVFKT
jgi:hypothetical protein